MIIEAISPLEVDTQGSVPVLSQGPAPLNGPHQAGHFHIALRAGGLSWRATALILSLCMDQVACSKETLEGYLQELGACMLDFCWYFCLI